MARSTALLEEYRRCLERDFRQGHVGTCTDSSLKELLWQQLLEDPQLLCALQEDDTFAMLAGALREQLSLRAALQNLCKAFEVLELAAVNLYFFPWRKEFSTIKTFSGVYVHILQGVLSEADLANSFRRLGYVQSDDLHLVISQLPPGTSLLRTACGFFAARVECEILGKIVEELEPCGVSSEELLQARRETRGSLAGCVAQLRSQVQWPRGRELCAEPADGVDLYRECQEAQSLYQEPSSRANLPSPPLPQLAHGGSSSSRPSSREQHLRSPQGFAESRGKLWASGQEQPYGNGMLGPEGPGSLETSFSFISLRRELSRTSDTDLASQAGSRYLSAARYDSSSLQSHGTSSPASPRQPRSPQLSPASMRRAPGAEPPRYHLHSCLRPGALPAYCCNTCRLLHGSSCNVAQLCWNNHHVEELQSEKQQRLWLQRTEVDKLLHEGAAAWQEHN